MEKKRFNTEEGVRDFFDAYNQRDFDRAFLYLADDCIWDASEKRLYGLKQMHEYWDVARTTGSITESLGVPYNICFIGDFVFLEVLVRFEFKEDGEYMGKEYKQGDVLDFLCCDVYELNERGQVREARIYVKFFNALKAEYVKPEYDIK